MPQLQQCQKWGRIKRNVVPGDVVLIVDDSAPRGSWIIGRVTGAAPDEKGLVRQVWIKTCWIVVLFYAMLYPELKIVNYYVD